MEGPVAVPRRSERVDALLLFSFRCIQGPCHCPQDIYVLEAQRPAEEQVKGSISFARVVGRCIFFPVAGLLWPLRGELHRA